MNDLIYLFSIDFIWQTNFQHLKSFQRNAISAEKQTANEILTLSIGCIENGIWFLCTGNTHGWVAKVFRLECHMFNFMKSYLFVASGFQTETSKFN